MDYKYLANFVIGTGYSSIEYSVRLDVDGGISFYARSRDPIVLGFDDDSWDMPDFYTTFSSFGVCPAPVTVLRRIAKIIGEWIQGGDVDYFYFRSNDEKKADVYMRLIRRAPGMENFVSCVEINGGVVIANFMRNI